jgi:transcriptional regulator with XRE-family HTH domain
VYNGAMHLSDYMLLNDLDDDDVAAGIKCTRATISRIRRRKSRPDWRTIEKLKRFTNGAVVADDFQSMEVAQ